uniref:FCP1 homology domain-containing protein n=1 Tax=Guillardia theta TaxID=55529 RepID=A0A7S4P929_GUITH|mmetsp:Transcript_45735/g.143542  ORF Transcript_45735/g.143542 Transcript_45735/m.143542 type:complete len:489 (+) Transcript_45735:173-1639(+)
MAANFMYIALATICFSFFLLEASCEYEPWSTKFNSMENTLDKAFVASNPGRPLNHVLKIPQKRPSRHFLQADHEKNRILLESQLKEGAPPRVAGAVGRFKDEELEDEVQHQPHKRLNVLCLLDLDMTCFWGNDANDLGCAMLWMQRSKEDLKDLYRLLWNEEANRALDELSKFHDRKVCIYTMRSALLMYHSCFRRATIALRWDPSWHYEEVIEIDGELKSVHILRIPGSITDPKEILQTYSGDEPLLDLEERDIGMCLLRLLTARDVLKEKLGLEEAPETLVTCSVKDVVFAAECVGHVGKDHRAFLWDDNELLKNRRNVLMVKKFDRLPAASRKQLLDFLEVHLPLQGLSPRLKDFLLGAPETSRVLEEEDGRVAEASPLGEGSEEEEAVAVEKPSGDLRWIIRKRSRGILEITSSDVWSLPLLPGLNRRWATRTIARMGSNADITVQAIKRSWSRTIERMGSGVETMLKAMTGDVNFHDAAGIAA